MPIRTVSDFGTAQREDLLELWKSLVAGNCPPSLGEWQAFERLIVRGFALEGAPVREPYSVPPEGQTVEQIDGAVYIGDMAFLLEAKNWAVAVDVEPLAKLRSQLLRRPAGTMGAVFSRSGFTDPAKTLATYMMPQAVLLWEGKEIELALEKKSMCEGMRLKLRHAVEQAMPDYNLVRHWGEAE